MYAVVEPVELIETKGEPHYQAIPETRLEYAENTNANLFRLSGAYYLLISGRWFKGVSLDGPWSFVDGKDLPPDFAKIPTDNPKGTVLASVPGTSASEEALIANSIPQTATITRAEAKLTVKYDDQATFAPIEGTSMQYANNTSAAVIKVSEGNYYSVEAGVWFKASSPQGPWEIAESVPAEIYTIPTSSPLHYVTYVKVYGSTPEVVYVGYTPGYYGTVVSASTTTVVYGTGWYYSPYIGPTAWYGYPYTYGVGAGFTYTTSTGWSFGFGFGYAYYPYYYPWWGPMGYYGYGWYPYYGWGAWGGAAAANVYGVWGIPLTLARAPRGRIHTPEIMVRRHVVVTTTARPAGAPSPDGATTRMPTRVIRAVIAVPRPTTRTPELSPAAVPDTSGMSTPARGRQDGAHLPTTRRPERESLAERIISMRGKTAASTVTIARLVIGHQTRAVAGSPRPSLIQICNGSNKCARKGHNAPTISTRCALTEERAVVAWAVPEGDSDSRSKARPRYHVHFTPTSSSWLRSRAGLPKSRAREIRRGTFLQHCATNSCFVI